MYDSPRINSGSNFATTEFSAESDATNAAPPTSLNIGGSCFTYPNLGKIGSHHAGLNPAASVG